MGWRQAMRRRTWYVVPLLAAAALLALAAAFAWHAASTHGSGVRPRAGLDAYSWEELSAIADELSGCPDQPHAIRRAARYGLCAEDGSLDAGRTKEVELVDGSRGHVAVAGIWHDERTDGGMAGLSLVFVDVVGEHAMNHGFEDPEGDHADNRGGWAASDMRAWLNGDFLLSLPPDLRGVIVSVQKRTASSVGGLAETDENGSLTGAPTDWVQESSERVWLLSASELCGSVPTFEDLGVDETMSAVYAGEGDQYRLFADGGVAAFAPSERLVRRDPQDEGNTPRTWWLRTKTLEFDDGFWLVGTDGTPLNGLGEDARVVTDPEFAPDELWGPDHARGVVAGFCL